MSTQILVTSGCTLPNTMASTSTSAILSTFNASSTFTSPPHHPSRIDKYLDKGLEGNVLWEELDLTANTPSLMSQIIPKSCLDISTIEKISYKTGEPIFVGQKWKFEKKGQKVKKLKQVQDDCEVEVLRIYDEASSSASVAPRTSFESRGSKQYYSTNPARKRSPRVHRRDSKWSLLFNTIYTSMRISYLTSPERSPIFPFERGYPEHLYRQ